MSSSKRSTEVSTSRLEALAFEHPGSVVELGTAPGWARLTLTDGTRYHAWRQAVTP